MKLPENKQERTKILALILVGVGMGLYIIVSFGVKPLLKSRAKKQARIEELKQEIEKVDKKVKLMARDEKLNRETIREIKEISDEHVLQPRLGNYLLVAAEIIEGFAAKLGIPLQGIVPIGPSEIRPISGNASDPVLKAYTVRVTLESSYGEMTRLIQEIESDNPLLCAVNVGIAGRPKENPEKHKISFDVQWPTWVDPELPVKLADQLTEPRSKEASSDAK